MSLKEVAYALAKYTSKHNHSSNNKVNNKKLSKLAKFVTESIFNNEINQILAYNLTEP